MMGNQLAILQVVIPLIAAPLCLLLRHAKLTWLFTLTISAICTVIALLLLQQVTIHGPVVYALGDWQAPIGIEYRIDVLGAYLLTIVTSISSIIILASWNVNSSELSKPRQPLFYVTYLLCLTGMLGIIATGDVFNLFIFIEISALASYTLIAMGKDRRALTAAFSYLLVGTLGATFILIGIGLMYMLTGTLNMHDLSVRLAEFSQSRTLFTAFSFVIVGVCLKLALFPLHWWLPNAYAFAPSIASAFLAATATKVAIYILLRFIFGIFGQDFSFSALPLQNILMTLGIAGILLASTMAIYQQNAKHLLAYSSVAQIGYMILTLGFNTHSGLLATLVHVFNHALMKGALFLALAAVMYRVGSMEIKQFAGLGKQMPWTFAAIVIGGLSLIGIPLTVGFISKWYMIVASLENGWWPVALVIVIGSLLAAVYVWRIFEVAYLQAAHEPNKQIKEAPVHLLIPVWLLTLANLYFGIDVRFTLSIADLATHSLLGSAM
ncbi:monovalent cation/H+ antiporter subunit D family protein [Thalassotalea fusca]